MDTVKSEARDRNKIGRSYKKSVGIKNTVSDWTVEDAEMEVRYMAAAGHSWTQLALPELCVLGSGAGIGVLLACVTAGLQWLLGSPGLAVGPRLQALGLRRVLSTLLCTVLLRARQGFAKLQALHSPLGL